MPVDSSQPPRHAPGFIEELSSYWRRVPDKALFLTMLLVWSALFHFLGNAVFGYVDTPSLFHWMYWVFNTSEDDGHGMIIPLVVLVLLWWKRDELVALPTRLWWPGLAIVLGSLLLHIAGYLVQQTRVSIVAYFLGIYGMIGLVWGSTWLKRTFFPMFLFVFCVPLGTISEPLTFPLRMLVAKLTHGIAHHVLGISVIRSGSQIWDSQGRFAYDVVAACSGIRSLSMLAAMTTICAFVCFRTAWRRTLTVLLAVPLAIANNLARVLGIIVAEEAFGHRASALAHEYLGYFTFVGALLVIMAVAMVLREPPLSGNATLAPSNVPA